MSQNPLSRFGLIALVCPLSLVAQAATDNAQNDVVQLQEVIVTAQKKSERIEDVPIPVTAISSDTLVEQNQVRFSDYFSDFPGLSFGSGDRGEIFPTIRGLSTGTYLTPTVGILIDDLPFGSATSNSAPDLDPSDLDHVEVLRGPQGTLYGASSMGGLIKYVTAEPSTAGFSARLESGLISVQNGAGLGYEERAAVNLPINETLAVRLSGFTREDPGYIDDPVRHVDGINEGHTYGGHLAALWKPSDTLSVKFSALMQHQDQDGSDYVFTGTPGFADLQQHYNPNTEGYSRTDDAFGLTVKGKLGDIDVTSVTGYSFYKHFAQEDLSSIFSTYVQPLFGVGGVSYRETLYTRKFTQELRFSGTGKYVDWLVGGFFTHETDSQDLDYPALDTNTGAVAGFFESSDGANAFTWGYKEISGFADVTFHVTDQFDVQLGGRESHETQPPIYGIYTGPYATDFFGGSPYVHKTGPDTENPFTYLFTPQYRFSPDLMVYLRLASGYRPGGGNTALAPQSTFAADKTKNYELGVKGSAWSRMLSYDLSVYRINWDSIQLPVTDLTTGVGYTTNAGSARSQGVEISTEFRPLRGLSLSAWATWDQPVLTQTMPIESGLYGLPGSTLPYAAHFSSNFSIQQDFPLAERWNGFVGGKVTYMGEREGNFQYTAARSEFPAYAEIDLRAGVKYDTWKVGFTVDNAANRRGVIGGGLDAYFPPYPLLYIRPRTYGLTVTKDF